MMPFARERGPAWGLTLVLAGVSAVAGCGDATVSDPWSPDGPARSFLVQPGTPLTAEDSAAYEATARPGAGGLTIQAVTLMVLEQAGGFEVEVTSVECAAQGNTVTIVEPVSAALATNACAQLGATARFEGPFEAGTEIRLSFHSGYTGGGGAVRVSGSYPVWTVAFEDGWDADYNDVVVTVRAFGGPAECPAEPYFTDPAVVAGLEALIEASAFDAPQPERREEYGWVVEGPNGYDLIPVVNEATNPCQVQADPTPPAGTVGWVHTHPFADGERIAPGVCPTAPGGGVFRAGPSGRDERLGEFINDQLGRDVPGFVIDRDGVIRFTVTEDPAGTARVDTTEFAGCMAGGEE